MTENSLIEKTNELIDECCQMMRDKITDAIKSGAMNIEAAEDNYILPKTLLCALLKEAHNQFELSFMVKNFNKQINTIYAGI